MYVCSSELATYWLPIIAADPTPSILGAACCTTNLYVALILTTTRANRYYYYDTVPQLG